MAARAPLALTLALALVALAAGATVFSLDSHDDIKGGKNTGCFQGCIYADDCHAAGSTWTDQSVEACKRFVCNAKTSRTGKVTYDVGTQRCPKLASPGKLYRKVAGNATAPYPACCPTLVLRARQ